MKFRILPGLLPQVRRHLQAPNPPVVLQQFNPSNSPPLARGYLSFSGQLIPMPNLFSEDLTPGQKELIDALIQPGLTQGTYYDTPRWFAGSSNHLGVS